MAYIKTTTNKQGRTHVYLVEVHRVEVYRVDGYVKHRIIYRYGLLEEFTKDEPDYFSMLEKRNKVWEINTRKNYRGVF